MPDAEKEILATLVKALQQRTDEEEDKDLKTLFREVRDELRVLNGNTKEEVAARKKDKEIEELAKKFPALREGARPGPPPGVRARGDI
jgi:hypothetical protein